MICPYPPGEFPPLEVPLLSVCSDVSRGLQLFSVAVTVAAALVALPAAAAVSSPRLTRSRDWPDCLLLPCGLYARGLVRSVWKANHGMRARRPQKAACVGWNCER
jgi:hypothetical protein